jgi:hypothetical protein
MIGWQTEAGASLPSCSDGVSCRRSAGAFGFVTRLAPQENHVFGQWSFSIAASNRPSKEPKSNMARLGAWAPALFVLLAFAAVARADLPIHCIFDQVCAFSPQTVGLFTFLCRQLISWRIVSPSSLLNFSFPL